MEAVAEARLLLLLAAWPSKASAVETREPQPEPRPGALHPHPSFPPSLCFPICKMGSREISTALQSCVTLASPLPSLCLTSPVMR